MARRRRIAVVPVLLAVTLVVFGAAPSRAAGTDLIAAASVTPRVFSPNGDHIDDVARLHVVLRHAATVSVDVVDYAGARVRTILAARMLPAGSLDLAWNGRTRAGSRVLDGGYRFVVRATDGTGTTIAQLPFTKAARPIYPAAPGAIVIALDAGHGGPDPGAVRSGLAEKAVTLDIVRRLRAMLQGAGVQVVTSRTADARANARNIDWTGDGKVGYPDELAARVEMANSARAAVFLCIHTNAAATSSARGTETYLYANRSFASSSRLLANQVQTRLLANLTTLRTWLWRPVNRGVRSYDFYVLNGYDAARRPRPTLMPGVLAETLFISNPRDRSILGRATGRQRLAIGFYEALVRYFGSRPYGASYEPLGSLPSTFEAGTAGVLNVRVRNTSPRAWAAGSVSASLGWVPAVPWYDGTNAAGRELARIALPALAPGASVDLAIPFTAPAAASLASTGGRGLLKLDLVSGSTRFATAGVVPYQVAFAVTSPAPTPTPTPTPAPTPTPTPSPSPTPAATPSPAPSPSPAPTPTPSPSPTPAATPSPAPTPSPTTSPTPTLTPSPIATQSPSVSPTTSPTPSAGATPSPTPSLGPAQTDSPTPSPTPSLGPAQTASPSPAPTPTPTPPSPTPSSSPTPTPSPSASLEPAPT